MAAILAAVLLSLNYLIIIQILLQCSLKHVPGHRRVWRLVIKPCGNVCEWASSASSSDADDAPGGLLLTSSSSPPPATLFAIQPARIYVNEEATFIPKASQGCSSSAATTNTADDLLLLPLSTAGWMVSDGRQIATSTIDDGVPESISMSFPTAGMHQVTLTLQDSSTGDIGSLSRYITVSPNDPSLLFWYELTMESSLIDSSAYANGNAAIFQTLSTGLIIGSTIPHHMIDSSTNCGSSIDLDGDSGLKLPSKARNSINDLSSVTAGIWAKFDTTTTTTTSGGRAQLFYKHATIGIRVEDGNVLCAAGTASTFKETSALLRSENKTKRTVFETDTSADRVNFGKCIESTVLVVEIDLLSYSKTCRRSNSFRKCARTIIGTIV